MPKRADREYRSMERLEAAEQESESMIVRGYATTFDKPYMLYEMDGVKYYEKIARGALDGADLSDVIMQYDHAGRVLARNTNGTLRLNPDSVRLNIEADLSKSDAAQALYRDIKAGLVNKMSWCFRVKESAYDRETHTRTITKISKVYDVSAVSLPASDDTDISARSFFDGEIEKEKAERLSRRRRKLTLMIDTELED